MDIIVNQLDELRKEAYEAGRKAAIEEKYLDANPYSIHSIMCHWWQDGWFDNWQDRKEAKQLEEFLTKELKEKK